MLVEHVLMKDLEEMAMGMLSVELAEVCSAPAADSGMFNVQSRNEKGNCCEDLAVCTLPTRLSLWEEAFHTDKTIE